MIGPLLELCSGTLFLGAALWLAYAWRRVQRAQRLAHARLAVAWWRKREHGLAIQATLCLFIAAILLGMGGGSLPAAIARVPRAVPRQKQGFGPPQKGE